MANGKDAMLEGNTSVKDLIREFNWDDTPLGDKRSWPAPLKISVSICLNSRLPAIVLWDNDLIQIYNEPYRKLIGEKHPAAFGSKAKTSCVKRQWDEVSTVLKEVIREGKSVIVENHRFTTAPDNHPVEPAYTVSYSPIYMESAVKGIFISVIDNADKHVSNPFEQNKYFQHLMIQAPIALSILSGPEFIIDVANKNMLTLWGRTAEQVINKPLLEVIPDVLEHGHEILLNKVYHTGESSVVNEMPLQGNLFVKLLYEPFYENDGNISGISMLAFDITEQVSVRKRIEESELRLKLALEAGNIGTFEWKIPESKFLYSDRLANIFGYNDTTGLLQKDLGDRIHPDDQPIRLSAHKNAFETGKLFYEARVVWPDESIHWVRLNGKVVYDSDQKPLRMYGTAIDITEQKNTAESLELLVSERTLQIKQQNEELKLSEERYHKMIGEVQEYAIILLDRDGIILNWNKGAEKIKGYEASEIIGKHFSIFYRQEDRDNNMPEKLLRLAIQHGKAVDENWRVRKDKTLFWGSISITALHNDQNDVIGFSKVTRDLTERKEADDKLRIFTDELRLKNEALRLSEERYYKMIAEVQDYAIILLDTKGTILNWNTGAEKIKGYSANEIVGKDFSIFYTKSDYENGLPQILLQKARVEGKASHEGLRVRKDGSQFWGNIVITALHNNDGEIIGFSKVTRDLTEKKSTEDKLREYTRELEVQNKELEQFAYIASHDLQEPLRKIQTFSEIIQRHLKADESIHTYFEKIRSSAKRMSMLIKSVLNYSNLSKSKEQFSPVNLNTLIEHVVADFEVVIAEKQAIVEWNSLPDVKGISAQLSQLFANLLSNSLKFADKKPAIKITAQIVTEKEVIHKPEHFAPGKYHEIAFADNGIGFEQQYADQIFTMFQRLHTRQQYSGTGIGLALCKKIMENHSGHIAAKAVPGEGATFYVYLPV